MAKIEIRDLEHRFPDGTLALAGVNLTIEEGEFLVISGSSGSGKTTLARHLNGLLKPSSGSVLMDGMDIRQTIGKVRQLVGMVFQDADSQIVGETVAEDVAFGLENLGLSRLEVAARVASTLQTLGLQHLADKPCYQLSGGEKRRLAVAGVMAMQPRVLVLDEPFANLDYTGIQQVLRQLLELHSQGHTIVVTTHDLEKVIAHADRLAILQEGRLQIVDAPEVIVPELNRFGIRPPCYALLGAEMISWLTD
jgi:biotin transport system ATP-binding protein